MFAIVKYSWDLSFCDGNGISLDFSVCFRSHAFLISSLERICEFEYRNGVNGVESSIQFRHILMSEHFHFGSAFCFDSAWKIIMCALVWIKCVLIWKNKTYVRFIVLISSSQSEIYVSFSKFILNIRLFVYWSKQSLCLYYLHSE